MTTAIDIKVLAGVTSALATVGADATFIQTPAGVYDPATGDVTEGTQTNTSVKAIPQYRQGSGERLARNIQKSTIFAPEDLLTGIAGDALAIAPDIGDEMLIGSVRYKITGIDPIRSGDDIALYLLRIEQTR